MSKNQYIFSMRNYESLYNLIDKQAAQIETLIIPLSFVFKEIDYLVNKIRSQTETLN
jgi:hypothetical protein